MDPKIVDFLYISGAVLGVLLAYMVFVKPQRRPSRLKLSERGASGNNAMQKFGPNSEAVRSGPTKTELSSTPVAHEKQLNVIFQYNGHSFDAFEVLGLAAGSSVDRVEEAYREILAKSDPASHEFYECAYRAIHQR